MAQPKLILSEIETPGQLGRYQLGRELGRGFSSIVYEATDRVHGNRVAVKVLTFLQNFTPARRHEMTERFEREARAISALSHPAIVAIHEVGQADEGRQYIAMEYLEGESLRQRMERVGPLLRTEAIPLIVQIADALQYAHGRGVIHRDVKPDNIFLCTDGTARLMDFGIAHVFADDGLTQTGMLIGSPAYMSPEQINGEVLDGRTDVFSLAATLAEALTGRKPFDGPNIPAVMNRILNQPPQLSGVGDSAIRKALEHALAKSSHARTASAGAFAEALRKAVPFPGSNETTSGTQVMVMPAFVREQPVPRFPISQAAAWAAAACCLIALACVPFLHHAPTHAATPQLVVTHASQGAGTTAAESPASTPAASHAALTVPTAQAASESQNDGYGQARIIEDAPVASSPIIPTATRPAPPHQAETSVRAIVAAPPRSQPAPVTPAPAPTVVTAQSAPPPEEVPARPAQVTAAPRPSEQTVPVRTFAPRPDISPAAAAVAPRAAAPPTPAGIDTAARLVMRSPNIVPPGLSSASGSVSLLVSVNQVGSVSDARVTQSSGNPSLDSAAIATVMSWEFEPAFHNGHAVPSEVGETVNF